MAGRVGRVLWFWLPLAAYAATIFVLSSMSRPPVPSLDIPHFDKVLHFVEYAGFGLLLFRALTMGGQGLSARPALVAAIALGALYGASDEFHQMFVPQREADFFDLLADVLGATCGAGALSLATRKFRRPTG